MLSKKERAVGRTTAPRYGNISTINNTTKSTTWSSPKLKNQIGELLHLQNPFLCQAGYRQTLRLFERALRKYLAVKHLGVQL
jgi:hypothetical protein